MHITFKLFAMLTRYLPEGADRHATALDIADGTTPQGIIDAHGVPAAMAHLVLLNGRYLPPAERQRPILREGDTLAVWPPVAGG